MKYFDALSLKQLNELLDKACSLLVSLEQEAMDHNPDYIDTELATAVNEFFKEVNTANEDTGPEYDSAGFTEEDRIVNGQYRNVEIANATPYENYVMQVKQNIDQAVEDGILKSGTECMSYSYLSEEGFNQRIKNDLEFAKQWGDPNWLFPGEPLHDYDPDAEAQDWDLFGNNKI